MVVVLPADLPLMHGHRASIGGETRWFARLSARLRVVDLDHVSALRLGGWDSRYAVVLVTAARDGVAAALVDTNGDGADVDLDQYEEGVDGRWVEVASGNCDETGAVATGSMAVAWGRATARAAVTVEFQAATYTVVATDGGWWMFVIPSRSGDAPTVWAADAGAGS